MSPILPRETSLVDARAALWRGKSRPRAVGMTAPPYGAPGSERRTGILDNREHARSLRRRIADHNVALEPLALEAAHVFQLAGHSSHARWLQCEVGGYPSTFAEVPQALGLDPSVKLVSFIKSYRVQPVKAWYLGKDTPIWSHHFFVDPLASSSSLSRPFRGYRRRSAS